jgi:hypothetical protein
MSERASEEGHHTARRAAGAGLGAAAVGAGAYILWRRQRRDGATFDTKAGLVDYEQRLSVFTETRINPVIHDLLAPLAVRIHHATFNSDEQVIMRDSLMEQLEEVRSEEDLDPNLSHVKKALSYLRDDQYGVIGRRPSALDSRAHGYYSREPLNWALAEGEIDALAQAQAHLINHLNGV